MVNRWAPWFGGATAAADKEIPPLPLGGHPQAESTTGDRATGSAAPELGGKSPVNIHSCCRSATVPVSLCLSFPICEMGVRQGWEPKPGGAGDKGS